MVALNSVFQQRFLYVQKAGKPAIASLSSRAGASVLITAGQKCIALGLTGCFEVSKGL